MKRRWLIIAVALIAVSVVLDLLLPGDHGRTYFPGFYALFGLVGTIVIITLAWTLGRYWLERNEDYYKHDGDDD